MREDALLAPGKPPACGSEGTTSSGAAEAPSRFELRGLPREGLPGHRQLMGLVPALQGHLLQ